MREEREQYIHEIKEKERDVGPITKTEGDHFPRRVMHCKPFKNESTVMRTFPPPKRRGVHIRKRVHKGALFTIIAEEIFIPHRLSVSVIFQRVRKMYEGSSIRRAM